MWYVLIRITATYRIKIVIRAGYMVIRAGNLCVKFIYDGWRNTAAIGTWFIRCCQYKKEQKHVEHKGREGEMEGSVRWTRTTCVPHVGKEGKKTFFTQKNHTQTNLFFAFRETNICFLCLRENAYSGHPGEDVG